MGERLLCKQEVIGSIPFTSTIYGGHGWRVITRREVLFAAVVPCGLAAAGLLIERVKKRVVRDRGSGAFNIRRCRARKSVTAPG